MTPDKDNDPGRRSRLILLSLLILVLYACDQNAPPGADQIYVNGLIYTADPTDRVQQAFAVNDGIIVAVGSDTVIEGYRGENTVVVDLQGRFVMPGIHDMHMHPLQGGLKEFYECSFAHSLSLEEILKVVDSCAKNLEKGQWVRGGQWPSHLLKSANPPTRDMLNQITTEHPVFLIDWAVHNAWLNTMALQALGISESVDDPQGGQFQRDPMTGELTGILLDNAAYDAQRKLPAYPQEINMNAISRVFDNAVRVGITSIKDAMTTTEALRAYTALDERGLLKLRVYTSLAWKSSWSKSHDEELVNIRDRADKNSSMLHTDFAKIMLDGVPLTRSSAMLEPYLPDSIHGDEYRGKMTLAIDDLQRDVAWLDQQGLSVKIHATGDRSAREALNAIEGARQVSGSDQPLHEISHAQFIHPDDLPRFAELNVAAEMCPILWYPTASDGARAAVLGVERAQRMWPMRALIDQGATVFYGSDWPAVVPNTNPWPGIEAMVTRRNPYTDAAEAQWPEQAVSLTEALRIVTVNGAATGGARNNSGSIEVGKFADFIVLDRNLFEVPETEISDTQVLMTVVHGNVVHDQRGVDPG